jgi:hypothetical protein
MYRKFEACEFDLDELNKEIRDEIKTYLNTLRKKTDEDFIRMYCPNCFESTLIDKSSLKRKKIRLHVIVDH